MKLKVNYLQYYRRCKSIREDKTYVEYYTIRPTNEASFNILSVIYLKCLKIFVNAHKCCQPLSKRRLESARKNVQTRQSTKTITRVHYIRWLTAITISNGYLYTLTGDWYSWTILILEKVLNKILYHHKNKNAKEIAEKFDLTNAQPVFS